MIATLSSMSTLPAWLTFAIYALATARLTGILVQDQLTSAPRVWVTKRMTTPPDRKWREQVIYLVHCPWCVSIYVGAGVATVWYTVGNHPVLVVLAAALAFSQITGMISNLGRG